MSLRAEFVRMMLRRTVKRGSRADFDVASLRQRFDAAIHYFPEPPKGTKVTAVDAGGIRGVRITVPQSREDRHILYFHGGGYVSGSPAYYRDFIWRIAAASSAQVLCIYYRLSPEHPFPAALDDAVRAYSWLLAQGAAPAAVAIMGDSAGGGLAFATLLRLREAGILPPAAVVALSPWTDLAMTGASLRMNAGNDPMLGPEGAARCARMYLAGADPLNPHASPLYGDPAGLPPALIQVGSDEILRDDSVRMADKLRAAGCTVELEIWPRMPHVWQVFAGRMPEARRAIDRIGAFLQIELSSPTPPAAAAAR